VGWSAKGVGRGAKRKKKFRKHAPPTRFHREVVYPPHDFYSENVPPTRFLFKKCAPHTFSIQKTCPPLHFHLKNVYPHDVFFLHFFDSPIRRDSWTAAPAMILLQLHASALTINHASAHYY